MNSDALLSRAKDFFTRNVAGWFNDVLCKVIPRREDQSVALLSGIYLQLQALNEGLQAGGTYFRITPFSVAANSEAVRVLDKDSQGRIREVTVCLDSSLGGPDPVIRLATSGGSSNGNGVRLTPGVFNPLGKVPPDTSLFVASDTNVNGFVIEVA